MGPGECRYACKSRGAAFSLYFLTPAHAPPDSHLALLWCDQICSLSRERLFAQADMGRDLGPKAAALGPIVRTVQVPTLSPADLLRSYVPSAVRYLQVDVEGMDDEIVNAFPIDRARGIGGGSGGSSSRGGGSGGRGGAGGLSGGGSGNVHGFFRPDAVVFEWMLIGVRRFSKSIQRLQTLGYDVCWEEQNVVALAN